MDVQTNSARTVWQKNAVNISRALLKNQRRRAAHDTRTYTRQVVWPSEGYKQYVLALERGDTERANELYNAHLKYTVSLIDPEFTHI